jgi:hypothetical protein
LYVWIWRHLPGGIIGKLLGSLVLLTGALALLFLVIFPWVEPRLPFNHVTVDAPSSSSTPSSHSTSTPAP